MTNSIASLWMLLIRPFRPRRWATVAGSRWLTTGSPASSSRPTNRIASPGSVEKSVQVFAAHGGACVAHPPPLGSATAAPRRRKASASQPLDSAPAGSGSFYCSSAESCWRLCIANEFPPALTRSGATARGRDRVWTHSRHREIWLCPSTSYSRGCLATARRLGIAASRRTL